VVSWDYSEPYQQFIVPYPNVHLTFRAGTTTVNGVASGRQTKILHGRGGVFGVQFRPGCFRPFLRAPLSTITDRSIDAREVFDRVLPEPDPKAEQVADIVAQIAARPEIARVATLAQDLDMSVRRRHQGQPQFRDTSASRVRRSG